MTVFEPSRRVHALPCNFFDGLDHQIAAASETGDPIIDVSKGNPDLPTPLHVVRALQRAVELPENQAYPPFLGKRRVREAIALDYRRTHGVDLDPDTQVTVFHGSHEALMALPQALLDPGDVLTVTDPCYPPYLAAARLADARVQRLRLDAEHGFLPDLDAAPAGVLSATDLLYLNYPNNPTGAVATGAFYEHVLQLAAQYEFPVVNDFAYASLGFGGSRPVSLLSSDPAAQHSVEISTMSKSYSMAGWRFGYAVGNLSIIDALKRYQTVALSTVFGAVQDAAAAALEGDQSCVADITREYRARRDLVVDGLRDLGWRVRLPAGAFFVWVEAPGGLTGEQLAEHLLLRARVAVAPGLGFGPAGERYVRIGLVHDRVVLAQMLERIARAGLPR